MKRTPSMYAFYERKFKESIQQEDWLVYNHLMDDVPDDIRATLIKNEVIEGSVEETRNEA